MKIYAVMRLSKLKSLAALSGITRHDRERERLPYRENPERTRENYHLRPAGLYSPEDSLVDRWKKRVGDQKIRKNAVYAYEIVLSFSPSATPSIPVDAWTLDSARWLAGSFGGRENILDISVHMDEKTPHIHAVVVPIDKDGKLNAKHFTGSRQKLSALQDSYADAMESYGLSRGIKFYETPKKTYHKDHRSYNAKKREQKKEKERQRQQEKVQFIEYEQKSYQIFDEIIHNPRERGLSR